MTNLRFKVTLRAPPQRPESDDRARAQQWKNPCDTKRGYIYSWLEQYMIIMMISLLRNFKVSLSR